MGCGYLAAGTLLFQWRDLIHPGPTDGKWCVALAISLAGLAIGVRIVLCFAVERLTIAGDWVRWVDCLGRVHGPFDLRTAKHVRQTVWACYVAGGAFVVIFPEGYVKYGLGIDSGRALTDRLLQGARCGQRGHVSDRD
jgi:hypothetical protein